MPVPVIISIYVLTPVVILILCSKFKWVKSIGSVIWAYAVGLILSLAGAMPVEGTVDAESLKSVQNTLMSVLVPLAIPLMLFSCDFKLWAKSLPKTIIVLVTGVISIMVAVIAGFFVFKNSNIPDLPNVAAMITGIYTGGTVNFFALGSALNVDSSVIVLAYTFEMIVTFPFIVFIVAGGYKIFRKILPYQNEANYDAVQHKMKTNSQGVENYNDILKKENFWKMMLGLLLSLGMLAVGAGLSLLITGKLSELIVILVITTLAILASFSEKVRNLPKTFELGMFLILIFSVIVASQFNISCIDTTALSVMGFIAFVMLSAILLHFIFSRIFHVDGDLFLVGQVALLCSPPFVPPVVVAMRNRKVLISGIVIGLVGYAVGTYLGLLLSVILQVL